MNAENYDIRKVISTSSTEVVQKSEEFREEIFDLYGFQKAAIKQIRRTSKIVVDLNAPVGWGFWFPDLSTVYLTSFKHEGGLHELSHAWDQYAPVDQNFRRALAKAAVQLADHSPQDWPEFGNVIKHAQGYVYGIPEQNWRGMFATYRDEKGKHAHWVQDPHNIREWEWKYVLTGEIYAGFSSFMMGKFREGPHILPGFMWKYFELMFTGKIKITPYYEGGHP